MLSTTRPGGPYFDDLQVGYRLSDAPASTLTATQAGLHQAIVGERFRLALDAELCAAVTGSPRLLVSPLLVCSVAIGQSTEVSQRVRANLFYRRLVLLRPVYVGDTLTTTTEVTGMRKNTVRAGKPATGLVVLRIQTVNQNGQSVLDFWRCPMLPLSDPTAAADRRDDVTGADQAGEALDLDEVAAAVPARWRLAEWCRQTPGVHGADLAPGMSQDVGGADVVTNAPELARMTLNLASAHYDPSASPYRRRLVYGGHTIALAAAALTRVLPNVLTILAWRRCDHTGPVFEDDVLRSRVEVDAVHPLRDGVALCELHITTTADSGEGTGGTLATEARSVLDWQLVALI